MKYSPTLLAFAALFAIVYGVLFSRTYPLVDISGGIVALCAFLGLVTCLSLAAIWNAFMQRKTSPADATPPPPASTKSPAPPASRRKRSQKSSREI
jgi:hypothetical protein